MSTDLELSAPQQRWLPTTKEAARVWALAQQVADTEFVPKTLRGNPHAIMAAMLTGREIGIGPMHALRAIDVIDGRPSLSAELMASLVQRDGHMLWVIQADTNVAIVAGRRSDWPDQVPDQEQAWSIADAQLAELVDPDCDPGAGEHAVKDVRRKRGGNWVTVKGCECKDNWRKYPRAMLKARAISELCRSIFADVVERVGYVAEELDPDRPVEEPADDPDVVDAEIVDGDPAGGDGTDEGEDEEVADAVTGMEDDSPGVDTPADPGEPTSHAQLDAQLAAEGWDADPPADEGPFDWKAAAKAAGVTPAWVLTQLRKDWSDDATKPNSQGDVTALLDGDDTLRTMVEATISDLAAKAAA